MTKGNSRSSARKSVPNLELLIHELKTRWAVEKAGLRSAKRIVDIAEDLLVSPHTIGTAWQAVKNLEVWDE